MKIIAEIQLKEKQLQKKNTILKWIIVGLVLLIVISNGSLAVLFLQGLVQVNPEGVVDEMNRTKGDGLIEESIIENKDEEEIIGKP